jgi:hypothetical protein
MATILNAYSLSGGDTTSSTFTSTGDCITIEATTTSINGVNSLIKIQSSDDQSIWKDIGQIIMCVGSDLYCNDPIKVTGLYVRCLLITNDSTSGTITVTASNGSAGTGDLLSTENLADVANAATANHNLGNSNSTYVPVFTATGGELSTCVCLGNAFVIQVDTDSISFTMQLFITMDGIETGASWEFNLPTGLLPTSNFASVTDITPIMGLLNSGDWSVVVNCHMEIGATVGAKTGLLTYIETTPVGGGKFPVFIRYQR